jgi:hypothetical protein
VPNIIWNFFCRICLYGQLVLKLEPSHGVIFETAGCLEFLLFYLGHLVDTAMITHHFSDAGNPLEIISLHILNILISHTRSTTFCSNIILGIYALEETGNCNSF